MIRRLLPYFIFKVLFGDRKNFGTSPDTTNNDWLIWQENALSVYVDTQQKGIGNWVCNLAYSIVDKIDFKDKKILEVGPGIIRHLENIKNMPTKYTLCDIDEEMLGISEKQLRAAGIPCNAILLARERGSKLPFAGETFDVVISFYSLEHLNPLDNYLFEIIRILKPGGQLVGGIPCEGGLAWGLGRFLTTRRYVHNNFGINYDKIICWEHPNFADFVIQRLNAHFKRQHIRLHPFPFLPMDLNLVMSFVYSKI